VRQRFILFFEFERHSCFLAGTDIYILCVHTRSSPHMRHTHRIMQLINRIQGLPLTDLSLRGNCLTDESIYRLSLALRSLENLRTLNLASNKIGDFGIRALFHKDAFPFWLRHLDLSLNVFTPTAAYYIGSLYAIDDINEVNTSHWQYTEHEFSGAIQPYWKGEVRSLRLESLFLGGNTMNGASVSFVRMLVSFLAYTKNRALKTLSVPFMGFTSDGGLNAIAALIACNQSITALNISNNAFQSKESWRMFRKAVAVNEQLININVGLCGLNELEKSLILKSLSNVSIYNLSWNEKAKLSYLVSRELAHCAQTRYHFEYHTLKMWRLPKPLAWFWQPTMFYDVDPPAVAAVEGTGADSTVLPAARFHQH
jgi:Leucine Rich repeat